ncbi:MAG: NAD(P)/FAD-dependent oxidoreductase [Gammaproteobacteria bacterium]
MTSALEPVSRRRFVAGAGAAATALSLTRSAVAASKPRVIVVGGGFCGAPSAQYLRLWSDPQIEVPLVDLRPKHVSCVMSNLVLSGRLGLRRLTFDLRELTAKYGIDFVRDNAARVEGRTGRLRLENKGWLGYDRVVVSTGIEFERLPGWNSRVMPHAWIAGWQTGLLRKKLQAMPASGTFVMTVPKAPYRCPPGPYERACTIADYLGRKAGVLGARRSSGGTPKVVVLDANDGITAERETFTRAFEELYGDIIEYYPGVHVESADSAGLALETNLGTFTGDVVNVIPTHRGSGLARRSRLLADSHWAPVDPVTYESTLAESKGVHIIGDSQATGQPKSGHMANAQAKVCADAIIRSLSGQSPYTHERLANLTTNSACFSPITRDEASWLTAVFAYDLPSGQMKLVPGSLGEAGDWNSQSYEDMFTWSSNLFADTFG